MMLEDSVSLGHIKVESDHPVCSDDHNSIVWFHPAVRSRLDAEILLLDASVTDDFTRGLFFIRPCSSNKDDYVLSVLVDFNTKHFVHYKILNLNGSFSLEGQTKTFRGIDQLIDYYRETSPDCGLQHPLTAFVIGQVSPSSTRIRGEGSNILHRAAIKGNSLVVEEFLKCLQTCDKLSEEVDERDNAGKTALHLATRHGHTQIVSTLIQFGANVNSCHVMSGEYPLHLACRGNHFDIVEILLKNGANPTLRNEKTSWLPLHVCANHGHIECAKCLIEIGHAPMLSRTFDNETVFDLASESQLAKFSDTFDKLSQNDCKEVYCFIDTKEERNEDDDVVSVQNLNRQQALDVIRNSAHGKQNGTFVIRSESSDLAEDKENDCMLYYGTPCNLKLTLLFDNKTYHFKIFKQGLYHFIEQGPYLPSLEAFVSYYSRFADGLPCRLRRQASSPSRSNVSRKSAVNLTSPLLRQYYLHQSKIHLSDVIGNGQFGEIYKGTIQDPSKRNATLDVAVKILNDECLNENENENITSSVKNDPNQSLLREAETLSKMRHPNIVSLLGVSKRGDNGGLLIVLELMPLGSLLDFIRQHDNISIDRMNLWGYQVSDAMDYLTSQAIVHRDLAARNILMKNGSHVKLSDFGLSRKMILRRRGGSAGGENEYRSLGGKWPYRWMAPESIKEGLFNEATDVWSFGILLWEIFTFGENEPYHQFEGQKAVSNEIDDGYRLPMPDILRDIVGDKKKSNEIYDLMSSCWNAKREYRPSFNEIGFILQQLLQPTKYSHYVTTVI